MMIGNNEKDIINVSHLLGGYTLNVDSMESILNFDNHC